MNLRLKFLALSFGMVMLAISLGIAVPACTKNNTPMKIGTNLWLGYEPLYLAQKQGLIDTHKSHLVEYTSASQVIRAYRNGVIDAAALTLDEALLLLENQFQPKIALVLDISNGADVILGQPGITRFEQLKHKRIGVEDSALGAYVLSRALEISHMRVDDVTVISMEMNKHERAFTHRDVDAVVTFEPVKSRLLAQSANVLFDSRQIAGEIVDVLVVDSQYYDKHPDNVTALKKAWFKALAYIHQFPLDAAVIMRSRQKLSIAEFNTAYKGIHFPDKAENDRLLDVANPSSDRKSVV